MLLWLTHTTGVRVTELALVKVADVVYPSWAIEPEVYFRERSPWGAGRAMCT